MASTIDTSKDPIYQTIQGVWDCLTNNASFASLVPEINRIDYTGDSRNPDKPGGLTADYPQVRVLYIGTPHAQIFRTTNSCSLQVAFAIEVKAGDRRLEKLTEVAWSVFCGMSHWETYLKDAVEWEGEKVFKRLLPFKSDAEYAPHIVRPQRTKPEPAGWVTAYAGIGELFISTSEVQAFPNPGSS